MLESQKQKLENYNSEYLNIGITQDGSPRNVIQVPWHYTASAFNMKTPHIYLCAEDMKDPQIIELLQKYHVLGCYIFDPLEDYSFIGNFKELWDVHIENGHNITNLSFMEELEDWFMFYLENACLENLDSLFPRNHKKDQFHSYCVGFVDCKVDDLRALAECDLHLFEQLVVYPKGANQKERWNCVQSHRYTYYEYDPK